MVVGGGPRESSPSSAAAASAMTVKNLLERIKKNGGLCQATEEKPLCVCVCVCGGERERSPLLLDQRAKALGQLYVMCTKKE